MASRPTAVGTDSKGNSVEGVAPGNPVQCIPTTTGPVSTEGFVTSDGVYHPAGTHMISINENGNTGNVREGQHVTLGESYLNGTNDDTVTVKTLAEIVVMNEDAGPDNLYQNPTFEVGLFGDEIMSEQSWIDSFNNNEMLPDGITRENYDEKMGEYVQLDSLMRFIGDEYTNIVQIQAEWDPVRQVMVLKGVDKSGIVAVLGMGTNSNDIVGLTNTHRLFTVLGNGIIQFHNWPEPDNPDDPDDTDPGPDGGGGEGGGKWHGYGAASMSANVSSDMYNVSQAIPTSENITGNVSATDISWSYSIDQTFVTVEWTFTAYLSWDWWEGWISVPVGTNSKGQTIYDSEWWEGYTDGETTTVTGSFTTHYFNVVRAEMSRLTSASVSNDTTGTLATAGPASVDGYLSRNGGVFINTAYLPSSVSGADHDSRSGALAAAQAAADAAVKNATFAQNDTMVMKNGGLSGTTPVGKQFGDTPYGQYSSLSNPTASMISNSGTKMIPSNKTNGWYKSSASASYAMVPSFDGKSDSAGATPPNVFVHTPVVNRATITVDDFINQKVVQESGLTYLQLDKKFTIDIPDSGTHIGAQGYGSRNYNSYQAVPGSITNWGKIKDVKVPFDAYLLPDYKLIKAGTWISDYGLATAQNSYTFIVPVWAEEAKGTIETRVVAENIAYYGTGSSCPTGILQDGANLDSSKYIAQEKILVEVIGKIYDLRISGTNDPGWPGIKGKEGPYITAQEFPFGQAGQNSQKQYRFAPKLGYVVEFDFKTKGVKTDNVDVSVQPEGFYFVSKDGGEAQEVDLFFKTVTNQYIKIDPSTNNSDIIVNLSNQFMRVVVQEIIDSRRIMIDQVGVTYTYNQNVPIGQLPALKMPEKLRLCYNNFAEYVNRLYGKSEAGITADANGGLSYSTGKYDAVNNGKDTVIASVGHWYAGYRLPSSTIAVPKGTTVNQILRNPNIAKKNGYILVKFDIVGKNGDEDYLRYTGPESITEPGQYTKDEDGKEQKWQDPQGNPDPTSPKQDIELPNGKPAIVPDGSVILFETDLKANNDYEVIGTH